MQSLVCNLQSTATTPSTRNHIADAMIAELNSSLATNSRSRSFAHSQSPNRSLLQETFIYALSRYICNRSLFDIFIQVEMAEE